MLSIKLCYRAVKIFLLIPACFALLHPVDGRAGEPKNSHMRILYIGNSLTEVNDLPGMIAFLGKSRHITVSSDSHTPGGYKLENHLADNNLLSKINRGIWDVVVLQDQSQMPALRDRVESEMVPSAKKLLGLIKKASPQARILFYETMAKRDGDRQNAHNFPEIASYSGMQKKVNDSYSSLARKENAELAPVGEVWAMVRKQLPSLVIYADDTHPNSVGTYLVACVFFEALFKQSSIGLPTPPNVEIDPLTLSALQKLVTKVSQSNNDKNLSTNSPSKKQHCGPVQLGTRIVYQCTD